MRGCTGRGHHGRVSGEPGLEALTDELYAAPPGEFVARRDELAKQTRTAGDRQLANAIKALRRPTVGAWYLNTAARSGLLSLRELVELGEQLRQAQATGDFAALRELAAQRNPLVGRVVRDLSAHLARLGVAATPGGLDEVRATLASVLADPVVSAETVKGRLDGPRTYSGFGELAFPAPPAGPATAPAEPDEASAKPDERAKRDRPARAQESKPQEPKKPARGRSAAAAPDRAEVQRARRELDAANAELAGATARRQEAAARVDAAGLRVEALAAELAEARDELLAAEADLAAAAEAEGRSARRVRKARDRLPTPGR